MINKRGATLDASERSRIEDAISEVRDLAPRSTVVRPGVELNHSTILVSGILSRYIDDRKGLRQLVAIHFPGDFVDLHAFPLKVLDHGIEAISSAVVACVPHSELCAMTSEFPGLARKFWTSTLIDAAIHRAWLFRLGRLDAMGRIAHFLSETNVRLGAIGLSNGKEFRLDLTQTDIAEISGLTNVHVNRVMRQLREEGLCVFRSSKVEIIDPGKLARRGQFNPGYLKIDTSPLSALEPHEMAINALALEHPK